MIALDRRAVSLPDLPIGGLRIIVVADLGGRAAVRYPRKVQSFCHARVYRSAPPAALLNCGDVAVLGSRDRVIGEDRDDVPAQTIQESSVGSRRCSGLCIEQGVWWAQSLPQLPRNKVAADRPGSR